MNKLITVLSQCIEGDIHQEIEHSDYVSLLCDETTDVSITYYLHLVHVSQRLSQLTIRRIFPSLIAHVENEATDALAIIGLARVSKTILSPLPTCLVMYCLILVGSVDCIRKVTLTFQKWKY